MWVPPICVLSLLLHFINVVNSQTYTPEFSDLERSFPPPTQFVPRQMGGISEGRLRRWTGFDYVQNFENLRLCWALNNIGGGHRIRAPKVLEMSNGVALPEFAVQKVEKSGQLFVLSDFDIGPYLTLRYGGPELRRVAHFPSRELMVASIGRRRGIIRFIMNGGRSAHVGLWKCDRVLYTLDQFYHPDMERVEFWPAKDWNCGERSVDNKVEGFP